MTIADPKLAVYPRILYAYSADLRIEVCIESPGYAKKRVQLLYNAPPAELPGQCA